MVAVTKSSGVTAPAASTSVSSTGDYTASSSPVTNPIAGGSSSGVGVVVNNTPSVSDLTSGNSTYKVSGSGTAGTSGTSTYAQTTTKQPTTTSTTTGGTGGTTTTTNGTPTGSYGGAGLGSTFLSGVPTTATTATATTAATATTLANNQAGTPVKIPSNAQVSAIEAEYGINNKLLLQNGFQLQLIGNTPVLSKNMNGMDVIYTLRGVPVGELMQLAGGGGVLEALPAGSNLSSLNPILVEEIASQAVRNQG